ncbi:hypothetical protein M0804_009149 [Polistes exclamans]|nr:hypothetical protein M0804_009149 [Polistes exclamans]
MFVKSLYSFETHFLYSKRYVTFLYGISPEINLIKRFAFFSIIFIFMLPAFIQMMTLIYVHVEEDYELVSDDEELNIIEKYTKESKYYTFILIVISNLYIMLLIFPSILNVILYHLGIFNDIHLTLPLTISNYVSDVGLLYYCLLIYQIIVLYIVLTMTIIIVSLYLVIIQHASNQFSIIMMKIRRPFVKDHLNNNKSYDKCDWIIDIITRYKRITEFVFIDLFNAIFEMLLMLAVFFLALQTILNFICVLQFSVVWKHRNENIEMIVFIIASMFIVYILFYVGQKLLDHSTTTFEELRQVPFYMLSVKTQKLFLFLIARSMKPSSISIGGLFVSSHEVFAALMQKAFSVATVFYSIRS